MGLLSKLEQMGLDEAENELMLMPTSYVKSVLDEARAVGLNDTNPALFDKIYGTLMRRQDKINEALKELAAKERENKVVILDEADKGEKPLFHK